MLPRNVLSRWVILGAVLLAGAGLGSEATAQSVVGVGAHKLDDRSLAYLDDLGARHVRTTLYWDRWESDAGYRRLASREIDRAVSRGLRLLVVVHGQPRRFTFRNRDAAFDAYARLMGDLAERFPGVEAWQLWNEMDMGTFTDLFGARNDVPYPRRGRIYASMLERVYPAIRAADPDAIVVTGGIAAGLKTGFLEAMLEADPPFDAIGLHAYGFPASEGVRIRAEETRTVLRAVGRTRTPVWLTEFGLEQSVVVPGADRSHRAIDRYHLEAWRDPVLWNNRTRAFARMYGHVLTEGGDLSYDLVRRDGSLRPAATWLRSYLH